MTDDLTRRAIIAAHDAECPERCDATHMPSLSKREQAIVELWRDDQDDYQGRYETSHNSRMHAENRLNDMAREARLSRESTEKAVARAKKAEATISRVRALASDDADLRSGVVGLARVTDIRRVLDGTEVKP